MRQQKRNKYVKMSNINKNCVNQSSKFFNYLGNYIVYIVLICFKILNRKLKGLQNNNCKNQQIRKFQSSLKHFQNRFIQFFPFL